MVRAAILPAWSCLTFFQTHSSGLSSGEYGGRRTASADPGSSRRTSWWPRRYERGGRYRRKLADTASGAQEVLIHLHARRFFCGNGACAKGTFAEQVPGLTTRYGRRTCGLQAVLLAAGLALGARAGARLTGRLACSASRSTLLRLIRAAPDPRAGLRWCWALMTSP